MANKAKLPTTKQSNYITSAKYDFTVQEKRILYRIVEQAAAYRREHEDFFLKNKTFKVKEDQIITMPITRFMPKTEGKGGRDREEVIEAFQGLIRRQTDVINEDSFDLGGLICRAYNEEGDGNVTFQVHRLVWQSALDFSKGFTQIDLSTVFQFKSAYSMRFYEMAKRFQDTHVWRISVEDFRKQFGCVEKYPLFYDMKRYIINVAKKELDKISPISFTYELEKKGRNVVKFKFTFYEVTKNKTEEQETRELQSKYAVQIMDTQIKNFLRHKLNLDTKEISSNIKTWDDLHKTFKDAALDELEETYQYITRMGKRPVENVGLFIDNIKKKIKNARKK